MEVGTVLPGGAFCYLKLCFFVCIWSFCRGMYPWKMIECVVGVHCCWVWRDNLCVHVRVRYRTLVPNMCTLAVAVEEEEKGGKREKREKRRRIERKIGLKFKQN